MLQAHCAAYRAIKALPGSGRAAVGLVHHSIEFEPAGQGLLYAPAKWVPALAATAVRGQPVPLLAPGLACTPHALGPSRRYACDWMTYWWGRDVVHTWLTSGAFEWRVPLLGSTIRWALGRASSSSRTALARGV